MTLKLAAKVQGAASSNLASNPTFAARRMRARYVNFAAVPFSRIPQPQAAKHKGHRSRTIGTIAPEPMAQVAFHPVLRAQVPYRNRHDQSA